MGGTDAFGGRQTGSHRMQAGSRDWGLFCGSSEDKRTKIASVPATPFTWKGYAGRNFETELS